VRASSGAITQSYVAEGAAGFAETGTAVLRRSGSAAQVLDAQGRVLVSFGTDVSQDPIVPASRAAAALVRPPALLDVTLGDSGQAYRVMLSPVIEHQRRRLVVVAESLEGVDEAVRKTLILLLIAGPIALLAAGVAGWLLVRNALRPVDRMRKKAEQIGIDQLHERLAAPNPSDEIGQLASTLNAMLDRLEAGVTARRRLVADASHELRTPLAAMRAELDVSLRDEERTHAERATLHSVREDVDRMSRTVDNLLTLALADDGRLQLLHGPVELQQLAESAVAPLEALAAASDVALRVTGEPCTASGDPQRLHQALTNLIENAIKFTGAGGGGEVTVSSWRAGDRVGVTVADDGPGIPGEARARGVDRFYRADRSRSRESGGSGLGLAICFEIANAHGGRIWVQSDEGQGSAFSIELPGYDGTEPPRRSPGDYAAQRPGR
jgi:heavy metal sensor kinase